MDCAPAQEGARDAEGGNGMTPPDIMSLSTAFFDKLGFARLAPEFESFVHSRVKPEYARGCIFMYQELQPISR